MTAATQSSLFDITRRKSHGSGLSDEANLQVPKEIDRALALAFIRASFRRGITSHEVAYKMNKPLNSVSGRISELLADGLITRVVYGVDRKTGKQLFERGEFMGKKGSIYRAVSQ